MMQKRHRGQYKPDHKGPYELSRSRIENFINCPACFYLIQVKGLNFPNFPGYNINEATDILFKKDFDKYRLKQESHPFLIANQMSHLIPYKHKDFELWTQSLHFGAEGRMNTIHEETNLKVGGGLDDIWLNTKNNELHIVDYKSTSLKSADKKISLEEPWKISYKRQMDLYVWVMRRKGFKINKTGYFLYCNGDRFTKKRFLNSEYATMYFEVQIIEYKVNTDWIEPSLINIRKTLDSKKCPEHNKRCEYKDLIEYKN
jgi:hypothetical protein